jgi:DeoR family transcriptional regulator, copper-sensing transcriptional repressor
VKNLSPRRREILKLVALKGDATIEEIQQSIGISQATTYREVQALLQTGLVTKIPGGISLVEASATGCIQCGQEGNPRLTFMIEHKDGAKSVACCAHCGLMALTKRDDISAVMTTDFFNGTLLNARQAWYVLNSDVSLCCSPPILSFLQRDYAERFSLGFGGDVVDFVSAQKKTGS